MGTYRLILDLQAEPDPAVLQQVMKLLGILAPVPDGEPKFTLSAAKHPVAEIPTAGDDEQLLLGRDETATQLNISTSTLDRWRKKGLLPVVQLPGAAPKFSQRALRKFVAANSKISSPLPRRRARSSNRAK